MPANHNFDVKTGNKKNFLYSLPQSFIRPFVKKFWETDNFPEQMKCDFSLPKSKSKLIVSTLEKPFM